MRCWLCCVTRRPETQLTENSLNYFFFFLQTSKSAAIAYVTSKIHEQPNQPRLRSLLSNLLIQNHSDTPHLMASACRLAQSSLVLRKIDRRGISAKDAANILITASEAMQHVDVNESRILAQKAAHIYPPTVARILKMS